MSYLYFILFNPSISPPTKPAFINIAFAWKGKRWKINVVGIINIIRRYAPNLCLNPDMKSIDPRIKNKIAVSNKNGAINGGMFLIIITSTVLWKYIIFPGIA